MKIARLPMLVGVAAATLLIVATSFGERTIAWAGLFAATSSEAKSSEPTIPSGEKIQQRLREGTALSDVQGHFELTGDRARFQPSDKSGPFGCLENLNLDRVTQTIRDNYDRLEWSVSGTITEYRGANYLLISRAILKSRPAAGKGGKKSTSNRASSN